MSVLSRSAIRRGLDSLTNRVLYTVLLALVTMAVIVLVVPIIRKYSGTNEQIIGIAVLVVLLVELVGTRVHRLVDWLLYGHRGDAAAVSSRLARELETVDDEAAVPALVEALAESLRLSYAAALIDRDGQRQVIATVGAPTRATSRFGVRHSGRDLGELRAGRREPLNHQDERMLRVAASQLGMVLHASSLATELQGARERLVSSREDERRRLRRELHDGVGPTLAGVALGLQSAERAIGTDDRRARSLVSELRSDLADLVVDVRRVVDGLRPPLLDEIGLAGALTQLAHAFGARSDCAVEVCADELPKLPAAVEVAAYRICAEAITNVLKHAHATRCVVTVALSAVGLELEITDDGTGGAAQTTEGTGLPSIAERATELGGVLEVTSDSAGTRIRTRLPVGSVPGDA